MSEAVENHLPLYHSVVVTDCGSTTTKALLFQRTDVGWRCTHSGESPTTVEAPTEDVTVGVFRALRMLEERSGRVLLEDGRDIIRSEGPENTQRGVNGFLSTSSAGGGLQMVVCGISEALSTRLAQTAALGAGAIILDVIHSGDTSDKIERIKLLRALKPDIILIVGGTEGGAKASTIEIAELVLAANPAPRFGTSVKLPVLYAGNSECRDEIKRILGTQYDVTVCENVLPTIGRSVLSPVRHAVHEVFLSHVMSHSPGYKKLTDLVSAPILPTPLAVGSSIEAFSRRSNCSVLGVDIGGATTDVFSVLQGTIEGFQRTVSANLGMSYSMGNVLKEAGLSHLLRWLPRSVKSSEVVNSIRNKMIRPTTVPHTREELQIEHAVCREALRLALAHHVYLLSSFRSSDNPPKRRGIADIFSQSSGGKNFDILSIDIVIGAGGVLSHAPTPLQAAWMLIEGLGLEGITEIALDVTFMTPHLGALGAVSEEIASEIFDSDCLTRLGVSVIPRHTIHRLGVPLATVCVADESVGTIRSGETQTIQRRGPAELRVKPLRGDVDVGRGPGREISVLVDVGKEGIFLDGRVRQSNGIDGSLYPKARESLLELLYP